ncbi:MAG: SDR family oxidoreductase [Oligoflexia bacterium]|nr:SDR family oxidoreductase [Oligoflexia bacterium]
MNFRNQVVLITGASSGIGEALAREFARKGARLALVARREGRLARLVKEFQDRGTEAIAISCDVTREGDLEKAVARTREKWGRLDIAIANAGFGVTGMLEELALEDYQRQFETNVYGVLRTIWASLPELKKTRGSLVLMGSVAGHIALTGSSPYSMSKFAVRALAEALRFELAPQGVAVTLISPGFVQSDIRRVDNRGVLRAEASDPVYPGLVMPAETAARHMVRAIARRKKEAIITFHGKVAVFVQRHFPWVFDLAQLRGLRARREPTGGEEKNL